MKATKTGTKLWNRIMGNSAMREHGDAVDGRDGAAVCGGWRAAEGEREGSRQDNCLKEYSIQNTNPVPVILG